MTGSHIFSHKNTLWNIDIANQKMKFSTVAINLVAATCCSAVSATTLRKEGEKRRLKSKASKATKASRAQPVPSAEYQDHYLVRPLQYFFIKMLLVFMNETNKNVLLIIHFILFHAGGTLELSQ